MIALCDSAQSDRPAPIAKAKPADAWWLVPRHRKPDDLPDSPEIRRMATALQSEVSNAATKSARSLAHVLWAVATWADRTHGPSGLHIHTTRRYIEDGAGVDRRPAEWALHTFARWTGCSQIKRGWWAVPVHVLAAVWSAFEWIEDHDLLTAPAYTPLATTPAFPLAIDIDKREKSKGQAMCGCGMHGNGDRSPSLIYDQDRGRATCMTTRSVFALRDGPGGLWACHILPRTPHAGTDERRSSTKMIHNECDPEGGVSVPPSDPPTVYRSSTLRRPPNVDGPVLVDPVDIAGRAGSDPYRNRVVTTRLWPSGYSTPKPSQTKAENDRVGVIAWMAKRWSGASGARTAQEAMAFREGYIPTRSRFRFESDKQGNIVTNDRGDVVHTGTIGKVVKDAPWRAVAQHQTARGYMPERLMAVGRWVPDPDSWVDHGPICDKNGKPYTNKAGEIKHKWTCDYHEHGTGHVLFDIDGCDDVPGSAPGGHVERIRAAVEGLGIFGDVLSVIRTSSRGVQVIVALKRFRWNVKGFYAHPAVLDALRAAGAGIAAVTGGTVDEAVWSPSRWARLPGWRVREKGGRADPELATVWYLQVATTPKGTSRRTTPCQS